MVSNCCKTAVIAALVALEIPFVSVELGEVEVEGVLTLKQLDQIRVAMLDSGHELTIDKKQRLIEKIKQTVIQLIHHTSEAPKMTNSDYISTELEYDYTYLANLFSVMTGSTIEHYIIAHKIERIKELLQDDELNISQIAQKLNYSSVAHLSNQFKKVTGITPTSFKQLRQNTRIAHENV